MSNHVPELWKREKPSLQTDFLVRERIVPLLGNINGLSVLDVGCGEGYVSRKLANAGAIVEAFDNDGEMIKLAKNSSKDKNLYFKIGDLKEINKLYAKNYFDIVIISGVVCFLDKEELDKFLKKIRVIMKSKARIIIGTNHTDSYFKKAKSNWIKYLSEPDLSKESQEVRLEFKNHKKQNIFSGKCYFHTPEMLRKSLETNNFKAIKQYNLIASKDDLKHFSNMWIDEDKVPFHIIITANN